MSTSRFLMVWGAGGHGKVVADVARVAGYEEIAFVDDQAHPSVPILGCHVLKPANASALHRDASFVIAIGNNATRARCFDMAQEAGWQPATLIHPSATISPSAVIGLGTVVMPQVVVNACVTVGQNCILNTGAVIEHDCVIGDHVHIAPAAVLAGNVRVGSFSQVSMAAAVLPGIPIGTRALVGAGAVVTRPVANDSTVVGVPARVLKTTRLVAT